MAVYIHHHLPVILFEGAAELLPPFTIVGAGDGFQLPFVQGQFGIIGQPVEEGEQVVDGVVAPVGEFGGNEGEQGGMVGLLIEGAGLLGNGRF